MRENISLEELNRALKRAGDYSLTENSSRETVPVAVQERKASYFPIFLVFAFLVGGVALRQIYLGVWNWVGAMGNFMGGFFLVFSFFKLLNLRGFVASYSTYDVVAKRCAAYGYAYPFLELALGIACLWRFNPQLTNWATFILMSVSSIGVIQSLLQKRKIQCACLGAVFNLPMSSITLIEDLLMAGMALAMIVFGCS